MKSLYTVQQHINSLVEKGFITKENRRNGSRATSNGYYINRESTAFVRTEFESTTFTNSESTKTVQEPKEENLKPFYLGKFANEAFGQKVEETLFWLQNVKKIRLLDYKKWVDLFMKLEQQKINLDEFREFYSWLENQTWVKGAISPRLMETQIETWVRREEFANKDVKGKSNTNGTRHGSTERLLKKVKSGDL